MAKRLIQPNTTFYPAAVALITAGADRPSISIRPARFSHDLIRRTGEFVLNLPRPDQALLADCPVNIECAVEHELDLDSHTLFIGRVLAVHSEESVLDANGDVDLSRAGGIAYGCGAVRERPTYNFQVETLRSQVLSSRAG